MEVHVNRSVVRADVVRRCNENANAIRIKLFDINRQAVGEIAEDFPSPLVHLEDYVFPGTEVVLGRPWRIGGAYHFQL